MPPPQTVAACALASPPEPERPLTPFHQRILAEELTSRRAHGQARLTRTLAEARVDLNPHQVEAATFALESLRAGGCLLADEVGLGKTIEAGLVIAQLKAEGRTRVLVLTPAPLRAQWQAELAEKFELDSLVVDGRVSGGSAGNPFQQDRVVIASQPFAAARCEWLTRVCWDLVVIDEAHRLRNANRPGNKVAAALKRALANSPKLLLTATPLQNELSELFGLLSLLDEQLLGPEDAFRTRFPPDPDHGGMTDEASRELRSRLAPAVHRTLRRQVREYVRFTNRRSVVEDFTPSAAEQSLYEEVSEYLRRKDTMAIEPGKRTLLTLVLRKLLASSSFAIAPTLHKLADSLEARLEAVKQGRAPVPAWFQPDEVTWYAEEAEGLHDEVIDRSTPLAALAQEVAELRGFALRAEQIRSNAKGEALRRALDRVWTVARAHRWPEKAVIFTESRRTLEYLYELLTGQGWADKVSRLTGDASTPEARQALVEEFRNRTQILLSTEAGAEGLNLQFCNLVVNYDLPWNPQRIEQRIGRCHRYGQQRDVLVLNFLNRSNAADARLYELLEKKLSLFDGVFGASDEILGALETGVDFEQRVLDIYQSCRSPAEIDAAFEALRGDLETRIDRRMTEARAMLMERFDGEVRKRLRLADERTRLAVSHHAAGTQSLTAAVFGQGKGHREGLERAAAHLRSRPTDAVSYLRLDGATLPPELGSLIGHEGWWFVWRCEVSGLTPEESLVHLALVRRGDSPFRPLDRAAAGLLTSVAARLEPTRRPPPISVADTHDRALAQGFEELRRLAERRAAMELDQARERADRFTEDCLLGPRQRVERARVEWEGARALLLSTEPDQERMRVRAAAERLEREYRRVLRELRQAEELRFAEKDRALAALAARAKVAVTRSLLTSAYFWVD